MTTRILVAAAFAAGLAAVTPGSDAQSYPSKPIAVIVPFPPGGSSEILMRIVAQKFSEGIGQPMVVDLRPGGGGATGTLAAKRANPDGYTLLQVNVGSHAANVVLVDNLGFDPIKDFKAITQMWTFPSVLAVPASGPVRSVAELVALARSRPGGINYASQGVGSGGHILAVMFKSLTGAPLVHVPYKGAGQAVVDVAAGRAEMIFASYPSVAAYARDGRLRLLATTAPSRLRMLPEAPTMAEAGFPGVDFDTWFGMAAPAATPDGIVRRVHAELAKALRHPDVERKMQELAIQPKTSNSPDEFAALMASDIARLRKLAKELGARGD